MSTSLNREIRVQTLSTGGGRITCQRCLGVSRRTGVQCRAPAERGRNWCRFHGGKSRGPTSPEGRARCAAAKTLHGQETAAARAERSRDMALIRALESLGYALGMMTGARMRLRKPGWWPEGSPRVDMRRWPLHSRGSLCSENRSLCAEPSPL